MKSDVAAPNIPRWPFVRVVLHDDGSGVLTINGIDEPVDAADVDGARTFVRDRVAAYAREDLARPVRLLATDPDGRESDLAVDPDGHVTVLGEQPPPSARDVTAARRPARRTPTSLVRALALGCALVVIVAIAVVGAHRLLRPDAALVSARPAAAAAAGSAAHDGADAKRAQARSSARLAAAAEPSLRAVARRVVARRRALVRAARRRAAAHRRVMHARARQAREPVAPHATGGGVAPATSAPAVRAVIPARPARPRAPRAMPGDLPPAHHGGYYRPARGGARGSRVGVAPGSR